MHPARGEAYLSTGTASLIESVSRNVARYLWDPDDNSRMYGLFRTDVAQRYFPATDHFAFDWTFCVASLTLGTHVEIPQVLMHREVTPPERYGEYVRRDARCAIARAVPLLPMSRHVLAMRRLPRTRQVMRALFDLNLGYHVDYMRRYHPWLARVYGTTRRGSSRG